MQHAWRLLVKVPLGFSSWLRDNSARSVIMQPIAVVEVGTAWALIRLVRRLTRECRMNSGVEQARPDSGGRYLGMLRGQGSRNVS